MTSCRRSSGRSSSPVVGSGRSRKGQVRVVLPFFFAFRFCEFCVVTARSVLASSHPQLPLSTASFTAQLLAGSTLDRKRSSGCPILQREKRQCSVPFVWCPPCVRVGAIFQPNLRNQFFFCLSFSLFYLPQNMPGDVQDLHPGVCDHLHRAAVDLQIFLCPAERHSVSHVQ